MRQETVTYNVFSFNELSPEIQEKVLDNFRQDIFDEFECRNLTEIFQEILANLGLPGDDIRWSISNCQGDGVAFYGKIDTVNLMTLNLNDLFSDIRRFKPELEQIKSKLNKLGDDTFLKIEKINPHYDHHNSMEVTGEHYNDDPKLELTFQELLNDLESLIKDVSKYLFNVGSKYVDHIHSDEYIKEIIEINEYEFLSDGSQF